MFKPQMLRRSPDILMLRSRWSVQVWLSICASLSILLCILLLPSPRHIPALATLPPQSFFSEGYARRTYLRTGKMNGEGLGSLLQHLKTGIVLAEALNSEHILSYTQVAGKAYSSSEFWNGEMSSAVGKFPPPFTINARHSCRIEDHVLPERRQPLARGLCGGENWARIEMAAIRANMSQCTSITDHTDGDSETIGELNGCIGTWIRQRIAPAPAFVLPPLSHLPKRPITVGVHVRWGDMAQELNRTGKPYGSMGLPDIARILADIQARWNQSGVEVIVAMQNADRDVLRDSAIGHIPYTLVDSSASDPASDLYALSNTDILLVGQSSYGVVAHLIAPPHGLTVARIDVDYHKFTNTSGFGRKLVPLNEYTHMSLALVDGEKYDEVN